MPGAKTGRTILIACSKTSENLVHNLLNDWISWCCELMCHSFPNYLPLVKKQQPEKQISDTSLAIDYEDHEMKNVAFVLTYQQLFLLCYADESQQHKKLFSLACLEHPVQSYAQNV
jgi:hypothetical protein